MERRIAAFMNCSNARTSRPRTWLFKGCVRQGMFTRPALTYSSRRSHDLHAIMWNVECCGQIIICKSRGSFTINMIHWRPAPVDWLLEDRAEQPGTHITISELEIYLSVHPTRLSGCLIQILDVIIFTWFGTILELENLHIYLICQ